MQIDLTRHAPHHTRDHMTHIISSDLPGAIGETVRKLLAGGIQEKPGGLDSIARNTDKPRFLLAEDTIAIEVPH